MKQPPLDALKFQPLPELAAALRASKSRVLQRWRDEVTRLLPHADELTRKQLDNSLPDVLEQMARAFAAAEPGPTERLIESSPAHGETRFHQEFNFDELLVEYAILRRVIVEEVARELRDAVSPVHCIELNQAMDIALRQAAVAYADHQAGRLKAEADAMAKYLAFLSHDLRGGLNGALLTIEVLRRDLMNDPRYASSVDDLDAMRRSMLGTVATMERFLSAEKLRRGSMPVKVERVDLAAVFHDVARTLAVHTSTSGQRVEIDPDAVPTLHTDRELLTMVLTNLLSNAIKYGGGEPVRLTARCGAQLPDSIACRVSVIDRGPGIAPDQMAKLFAPFTRGETYGQKGVGLGLFIARQAADLLGARLWAESHPGEGATFHLDVPKNPPTT
jgi:signal transduction histidine kinase